MHAHTDEQRKGIIIMLALKNTNPAGLKHPAGGAYL